MAGKFIVFEGIDGCGKGTQLKKLANYLFDKSKNNVILLTREPTGFSQAGIEIRKLLATEKNPKENAEIYTKLFIEDRKHHINTIITPALNSNITVLCDRYKYSTIIYQKAQGEDINKLLKLHENMPIPDIIFILDIPPKIALERIKKQKEVFEKLDFLTGLRNGYLDIKEIFPNENIIIVDGNKTVEQIHLQIVKEVEKILKI